MVRSIRMNKGVGHGRVWLEVCKEDVELLENVIVLDESIVDWQDKERVEFIANFENSEGEIEKRFVGGCDVIVLLEQLIRYVKDKRWIFDTSIGNDFYVRKKFGSEFQRGRVKAKDMDAWRDYQQQKRKRYIDWKQARARDKKAGRKRGYDGRGSWWWHEKHVRWGGKTGHGYMEVEWGGVKVIGAKDKIARIPKDRVRVFKITEWVKVKR